jgi:hypothetical protein
MPDILYLPEPAPVDHPQDDVLDALGLYHPESFGALPKVSPVDYLAALHNEREQHLNPTQDWTQFCLKLCRTVYDIPALFESAYAQWLGSDAADKHVGGDPNKAPVGAALIFKGSGAFGHIMIAARPFADGTPSAWSNDLVRAGKVDQVHRTAPTTAWGQAYLGYITAINGYDLDLTHGKPAKPKQTKHYVAIQHAIDNLKHAVDTAHADHDHADVIALHKQIDRLKHADQVLRHAA